MKDFECRLKEHRKRKGLTQLQLAQLAGTHRDTVGLFEKTKREPSLRVALAISRVLDVPVEELFRFPEQDGPRE